MKNLKGIFLACIGLILLACCCDNDPYYCYINQETKDWGVYKHGSWWVYKKKPVNVTDSVFVTYYNEEMIEYESDKKTHFSENITINYNSIYDNILIQEYIQPRHCSGSIIKIKETNENLNSSYYAELLWLTPDIVEYFNFTSPTEVVSKYDSLKIEEKYYKDVVHVQCSVINYVPGENYESVNEFWLSKHNWIIKKIIRTQNDTIIWNLVKSNIIQ